MEMLVYVYPLLAHTYTHFATIEAPFLALWLRIQYLLTAYEKYFPQAFYPVFLYYTFQEGYSLLQMQL